MIPTMRRMVVLIEDVDEISALFERTWREHENDEKKGPAPAKVAGALSQPTADLRRLYVLARARVDLVRARVHLRYEGARLLLGPSYLS